LARTYSRDLRDGVIDAVSDEAEIRRSAARRIGVSEASAIKWLQRLERSGERRCTGTGGHRPSKVKKTGKEEQCENQLDNFYWSIQRSEVADVPRSCGARRRRAESWGACRPAAHEARTAAPVSTGRSRQCRRTSWSGSTADMPLAEKPPIGMRQSSPLLGRSADPEPAIRSYVSRRCRRDCLWSRAVGSCQARARYSVTRVSSDARPSRSAKPGHIPVPLLT
jgi:hypothetical protein